MHILNITVELLMIIINIVIELLNNIVKLKNTSLITEKTNSKNNNKKDEGEEFKKKVKPLPTLTLRLKLYIKYVFDSILVLFTNNLYILYIYN